MTHSIYPAVKFAGTFLNIFQTLLKKIENIQKRIPCHTTLKKKCLEYPIDLSEGREYYNKFTLI